jgi:predicted PurR-regulated permease PerM
MAIDEKRLSNLTLALLGATSLVASFWVCRGILTPIVMAGFLAVILQPVKLFLRQRLGRWPHLFAFALTLGVLVLIIVPSSLMAYLLFTQLLHGIDLVRNQLGAGGFAGLFQGNFPPAVMILIDRVEGFIPISLDQVRQAALEASKLLAPTLGSILAFSGQTVFGGIILLISLYFFFLDGEHLLHWIADVIPLSPKYSAELFAEFRAVLQAIVYGSVFGIVVSAAVTSLIYWIFGVPSPVVWGMISGVFSIAPVVGATVIWVPLGVVLVLTGQLGAGVGLLISCAVVFIILDNVVKPLVVSRGMTLHPLLVLLGIIGGATTLGVSGLVIGPLVLSLFLAIMRIYRRDFIGRPVAAGAKSS